MSDRIQQAQQGAGAGGAGERGANNNTTTTTGSSSPRNNLSPLPQPAGPRRPPPAIRLPSCQIQRTWDREQSPPQTSTASLGSSGSPSSRRSRAATIASPMRELSSPSSSLLPTSSATVGRRSAYASAKMPPPQPTLLEGREYTSHALSPNNTSSTNATDYKNGGDVEGVTGGNAITADHRTESNNPMGEGHVVVIDVDGVPVRQDQMEQGRPLSATADTERGAVAGEDSGDNKTDKPAYGWAGALMSRGRRRAATTAAALGMGGGGGGNKSSGDTPLSPITSRNNDNDGGEQHERFSSIRPGGSGSNALDDFQDPTLLDAVSNATQTGRSDAYDHQVHDLLDVLDPEVQTVNLLGDFQNTFFIPPNRLFDRTRKLQLTKPPEASKQAQQKHADEQLAAAESGASRRASIAQQQQQPRPTDRIPADSAATTDGQTTNAQQQTGDITEKVQEKRPDGTSAQAPTAGADDAAAILRPEDKELPGPPVPPRDSDEDGIEGEGGSTPTPLETLVIGETKLTKGNYFVLPAKLVDMSDWTEQEKADLDDYVRHLLHSKKEKFRRRMRGFGKYVRTPLGCFVTVYASLLTFWGTAWMLFIIGWLPAGDRQAYFVEICDQILVALFCLTGLGLIPWRIRDTYNAYYIIKYHRKTLKLRQQRGLPKLADDNDLPNDQVFNHDLEMAGHAQDAVLNDDEQALLVKHQTALAKSHTYYRPHETITHHAFPLSFLIAIIVLCDCHSIFQLSLGSATWSISYHHWYKKILTTIILCFSLSCNITGGICIAVGSRLSRKTEIVEALMRQAVTQEALKRKQDAERYRAEKKARKALEAERQAHQRTNSGGLLKTGSFPATLTKNATSAAALKLKLMSSKNNSDPGLREKLVKRRSSSGRSSLDSPRAEGQPSSTLRRSGSERVTESRFDSLEPHHE